MNISLSPDNRSASVRITADSATAEDIEELIYQLATARQEMLPEVPRYAPKRITPIDEPDIKMKIGNDGLIAFAIRSTGLGWLDVKFSRQHSTATVVACVGVSREMKADPSVFGPTAGNA